MAMAAAPSIAFSDDRFLRSVLNAAQRANAPPDAIRRIESMGFSAEAAQIALHVTHGDEDTALQLCMSGLCYLGVGKAVFDQAPGSGEKPGPVGSKCYICGQRYLTDKSLEIHLKACRKTFLERESRRPASERRVLIEAADLPEGFDCLQRFYEIVEGAAGPPPTTPCKAKRARDEAQTPPLEAWLEGADADLLPCRHCSRTFAPARLRKHEQVCVERPKVEACTPPPKRSGGVPSGPPQAAARAFEAFCDGLSACPGCGRHFRRELLRGHMDRCSDVQSSKAAKRLSGSSGGIRRAFGGSPAKDLQPPRGDTDAVASASSSSMCKKLSLPVGRSSASPGMAMRATRSTGSTTSRASTSPAVSSSAAATPKSSRRHLQTAGTAARGSNTPGVPANVSPSTRLQASMQEASSNAKADDGLSTMALSERGLLTSASEEDIVRLRAEVMQALPTAEFLGAYRIPEGTQGAIYGAMKTTMTEECEMLDPSSLELELWHGTNWATIPKILRHGFNRSFAGRHGTMLGHGTYFTRDVAYAKRFCDRHGGGQDGTKVVILARVLVGQYCKGSNTDVEPPVMDETTGARYNSTVDNAEAPKMFVVFRDFQAMPEFLVEFRA